MDPPEQGLASLLSKCIPSTGSGMQAWGRSRGPQRNETPPLPPGAPKAQGVCLMEETAFPRAASRSEHKVSFNQGQLWKTTFLA